MKRTVVQTFGAADGLPPDVVGGKCLAYIAAIDSGKIIASFATGGRNRYKTETTVAILSYAPNTTPRQKVEQLLTTNAAQGGEPKDLKTKFFPFEMFPIPDPMTGQPAQKVIIRRGGPEDFDPILLDLATMKMSLTENVFPGAQDQDSLVPEGHFLFHLKEPNYIVKLTPQGPPFEKFPINPINKGGVFSTLGVSVIEVAGDGAYVADGVGQPFRRVGDGLRAANWLKHSNFYGLVTLGPEFNVAKNRVDSMYAVQVQFADK
ncbi:MAG TPA: hypothetical protein VH518_21910 [Tepidisphaeraceae bacterium]